MSIFEEFRADEWNGYPAKGRAWLTIIRLNPEQHWSEEDKSISREILRRWVNVFGGEDAERRWRERHA